MMNFLKHILNSIYKYYMLESHFCGCVALQWNNVQIIGCCWTGLKSGTLSRMQVLSWLPNTGRGWERGKGENITILTNRSYYRYHIYQPYNQLCDEMDQEHHQESEYWKQNKWNNNITLKNCIKWISKPRTHTRWLSKPASVQHTPSNKTSMSSNSL